MYIYFKKCFLLDYSWLQFDSVLFPANSEQIGRGNTASGYQWTEWRDCLIQSHADLDNNYVKVMGIQLQQLYQLSIHFQTIYKGKNTIIFLSLLMTYFSTVQGYPPLNWTTKNNTGVQCQTLFKRLSEPLVFKTLNNLNLLLGGGGKSGISDKTHCTEKKFLSYVAGYIKYKVRVQTCVIDGVNLPPPEKNILWDCVDKNLNLDFDTFLVPGFTVHSWEIFYRNSEEKSGFHKNPLQVRCLDNINVYLIF